MINKSQIELVRRSFPAVARMGEIVGLTFYQRALQMDPALRILFRGDPQVSAQSFAQALEFAVERLDRWDEIHRDVQSMGRRHSRAGLRDEQYPTLATAFQWTLKLHLGPLGDAETIAAWDAFIRVLTETMIAAAREMRSGGQSTGLFARRPDVGRPPLPPPPAG